nr:PREDICTED: A-kinase anchor protein SPHKAP isoform X2 [Latimeria chalumnae]|eukprot:XP_005993079.1 PREDICTED: A-kinase anchor protein SPHKAP isoform X2 [Latimeria chalumnae]
MYEISEQPGSNPDSSASTLGSSVTACKKILCTNSLLDSIEYWQRNERTLCRIGLVDDKAESSCTTICFVNLDGNKQDYRKNELEQKLVSVSPDLPNLISSLNVQQPKDNEIFLLSGLAAPSNCQADLDFPQDSGSADVCLVQCARGHRCDYSSCVIFEINKFLIGMEFVQERQLQLKAGSTLKPEDDTNCSVSSIEEDFLTASEHLDDNDSDDFKYGSEKVNVLDPSSDARRTKGKGLGNLQVKKDRELFSLTNNCLYKEHATSGKMACSKKILNVATEKLVLQTVDKTTHQLHCQSEFSVRDNLIPDTDSKESFKSSSHKVYALNDLEDIYSMNITKDGKSCQWIVHPSEWDQLKTETEDLGEKDLTHMPLENKQHVAGQYATNLAESVLQDAFIRLSQSQPAFTTEGAVCPQVDYNTLLSANNRKADAKRPSQSWNELPKIVIVQSPDNCENTSDWPGVVSESPTEVLNFVYEDNVTVNGSPSCEHPASPVEVALAYAASVIGTISSPHTTERVKLEQDCQYLTENSTEAQECDKVATAEANQEHPEIDYSFFSALCGMTKLASAVAVVGLSENNEVNYPTTSCGLLAAAEASTAITLHCSVAVGSGMNNFTENIAELLLKEASKILTLPDNYQNVGDFIETINSKITETVMRPKTSKLKELTIDEFAENFSNIILTHSMEKTKNKIQINNQDRNSNSAFNLQDNFIETVNELLFNVMYFTCKKVGEFAKQDDFSSSLIKDTDSKSIFETAQNNIKIIPQNCSYGNEVDCFEDVNFFLKKEDQKSVINTKKESQVQEINTEVMEDMLKSMLYCNSVNTSQDSREPMGSTESNMIVMDISSSQSQNSSQKLKDSCLDSENSVVSAEYQCPLNEQKCIKNDAKVQHKQKHKCDLIQHTLLCPQPVLQIIHPTDVSYSIADFAEQLATTVVSMATEMAAICLENSNGKQPWFSAWKKGTEYLVPQSLSCRTIKRKKEAQPNASVTRKHRAPRLSEIKRKTEEHPELKERLMNRVIDESVNLDDIPDPVNTFATEVTSKIMNLTELSVDHVHQGQSNTKNRLHCERWNRGKASSCESIPEEDIDSSYTIRTLGLTTNVSQPLSRGSSVSKQSSCESITDEFSRFMVNQMESEGRGFDLLLDYYAGTNANNILSSAMQQVTPKNGHLSVKPSCPSKQSSTESITEEFYRYMLKELDKENKESASIRNTKEWSNSLFPPSPRMPFCLRQSSVPDSRPSDTRLMVNAPVKANSFDGFAQNFHSDTHSIQPLNTISSPALCKSDSCLYQRCKTDQITDMLIHETWSSSIEALMRKNKIITDDNENTDHDEAISGSRPHVELYANKLAADIVECGKSLIGVHQDPFDATNKLSLTERRRCFTSKSNVNFKQPAADKMNSEVEKKYFPSNDPVSVHSTSLPHCPREVPLIQIGDQREEFNEDTESCTSYVSPSGTIKKTLNKEKSSEVNCRENSDLSYLVHSSPPIYNILRNEVAKDTKPTEESPISLSSSDESTGSWSQLVNEEDHHDDTSSYLQLSDSNENSSTRSSLGMVDLEGFQETTLTCTITSEHLEQSVLSKEQQENTDECTSGLSVETSSCQKDLLVINFDLEPDCADSELRATLQWIAASELGTPAIYFRKSQDKMIQKFLDVVRFIHQKSWKVGDLFHAVIQYSKLQEENSELKLSLFDWLLQYG